jgi:hypothetical protein
MKMNFDSMNTMCHSWNCNGLKPVLSAGYLCCMLNHSWNHREYYLLAVCAWCCCWCRLLTGAFYEVLGCFFLWISTFIYRWWEEIDGSRLQPMIGSKCSWQHVLDILAIDENFCLDLLEMDHFVKSGSKTWVVEPNISSLAFWPNLFHLSFWLPWIMCKMAWHIMMDLI